MRRPAEQQILQLRNELFLALSCWELYRNISLDSSHVNNDALKYYQYDVPDLYNIEMQIYSQALIIQLHKIFDNHKDSINLESIIIEINNQEINEIYNAFNRKHLAKIRRLRNKVYAHTDAKFSPEQFFIDIGMSYTDIKNILDNLKLLFKQMNYLPNVEMIKNINEQQISVFNTLYKMRFHK